MEDFSKQDSYIPQNYLETQKAFLSDCISCGICISECPCIPIGHLANTDADRILDEVRQFLNGGIITDIVTNRAFDCCRCGICLNICPSGINVYDLQQALRAHNVAHGVRNLTLHGITFGNRVWDDFDFDKILSSLQVKPEERRWTEGDQENVPESEFVLYLGCSTIRYVSKINTLLDILERIGFKFETIAGICCGTRHEIIGKLQEAQSQGLHLISALSKYKPKEVWVYCPTCLYTIKAEIAKSHEVPFKIRSVYDVLADNIDKLDFKNSMSKKVAFHDPCKLGRMSGEYEPARKVLKSIPGLEFVELADSKQESNCCGGTAWRYNPEQASLLRQKAMRCAEEAGIDILATACLICYNRFSAKASEYSYRVCETAEIVGEALGIRYADKLKEYMGYHDFELVINQTKEYIEASRYSVEEMRAILPHLLP
jgi:Fe-S oxidoreductase